MAFDVTAQDVLVCRLETAKVACVARELRSMVLVVVGQEPGTRLKANVAAEAFERLELEVVDLMNSLHMARQVVRVSKGLFAKTAVGTSELFARIRQSWKGLLQLRIGMICCWIKFGLRLDELRFTNSFRRVTFDLYCCRIVFTYFNLQEWIKRAFMSKTCAD